MPTIYQYLVAFALLAVSTQLTAQEYDLSGFEFSLDQDNKADFTRDSTLNDRNYTVAVRLGIYGAYANKTFLGLPWVRQKVDGFILDKILEKRGFSRDRISHNFALEMNGFTPSYIGTDDEDYGRALVEGYRLAGDRPFSSFTGFRSTRRIVGSKRFVHSAYQMNMAFNTSFTFGFAGLGIAKGLDNLFGNRRTKAIFWDEGVSSPDITGQVIRNPWPLFMYSVSAEAVVLQPVRKLLIQVRPELNLGYYTNIGLGIDIGKALNVEKVLDNLAYTDTHNPSMISVNDADVSFSAVAGITARAVLYNAHLNGFFAKSGGPYYTLADTRVLLVEAHAGIKVQFVKRVEINFSVTRRTTEFKGDIKRAPLWGTIGLKVLLAEEGEGCY